MVTYPYYVAFTLEETLQTAFRYYPSPSHFNSRHTDMKHDLSWDEVRIAAIILFRSNPKPSITATK